jgi:hypothetical protein
MTGESRVEFVEDGVPLEGIDQAASDLIRLYGGDVRSSAGNRIEFDLPARRGVAASGRIGCTMTWESDPDPDSEGIVTIFAEREVATPRHSQILLLVAGTVGALAFTLWPFFPEMGQVACVGAIVAIGAYLLSIKMSRIGIVAALLNELAEEQSSATGAHAQ